MRGYRPSETMVKIDEEYDQFAEFRSQNVQIYARRAELGLPIFETPDKPKPESDWRAESALTAGTE